MKNIKRIMKDEEGLTLVELLAVVVIMAIIAGIAAVSISRVIQRTREDAQVSNVQQMIAAANLYDIEQPNGMSAATSLTKIHEEGTLKSISFVEKDKDSGIMFDKEKKTGVISIDIPAGSLKAGKEDNIPFKTTENESAKITRTDLFGTKASGEGE